MNHNATLCLETNCQFFWCPYLSNKSHCTSLHFIGAKRKKSHSCQNGRDRTSGYSPLPYVLRLLQEWLACLDMGQNITLLSLTSSIHIPTGNRPRARKIDVRVLFSQIHARQGHPIRKEMNGALHLDRLFDAGISTKMHGLLNTNTAMTRQQGGQNVQCPIYKRHKSLMKTDRMIGHSVLLSKRQTQYECVVLMCIFTYVV